MSSQNKNKIVMLGNSNVGKTCLVVRLIDDKFGTTESTIGASFFQKTLITEEGEICLELWDTAGAEKYDSLSNFYCRGAMGCLIVYDVTQRKSFQNVKKKWYEKLKQTIGKLEEKCFILLVGNKIDLKDRVVSEREGIQMAEDIKASGFAEISCKTGEGIDAIIEILAKSVKQMSNKIGSDPYHRNGSITKRKDVEKHSEKNCCI